MDHLCFLCLVFLMLLRLFIAALWLPAGKGLTSWLLLVMFIVFFVLTFSCGIQGHLWYLIVAVPDLCLLSYFRACDFVCLQYIVSIFHGRIHNGLSEDSNSDNFFFF